MSGGKGSSGRGERALKVRVKTAKGRKLSSTRWLQRQLNDPYVQRAKKEGYRGPIAGAEIMQLDFLDQGADTAVRARLGGPADVVLSDMAAPASGHRQTDHIRIMALAETAAQFAFEVLAPGGVLVAKVLQGGTEAALLTLLKRHFAKVQHFKPPASRKDSAEMFVVATGFRGEGA